MKFLDLESYFGLLLDASEEQEEEGLQEQKQEQEQEQKHELDEELKQTDFSLEDGQESLMTKILFEGDLNQTEIQNKKISNTKNTKNMNKDLNLNPSEDLEEKSEYVKDTSFILNENSIISKEIEDDENEEENLEEKEETLEKNIDIEIVHLKVGKNGEVTEDVNATNILYAEDIANDNDTRHDVDEDYVMVKNHYGDNYSNDHENDNEAIPNNITEKINKIRNYIQNMKIFKKNMHNR